MISIQLLKCSAKKDIFHIYIGFSSLKSTVLLNKEMNFLNNSEYKIFEEFKFEQKRKSFLQSRYLAKNVLSKYLEEADLTKIMITHGIFGHPLVNYLTKKMPILSISHTRTHTACIVSSAKYPTAIDIEKVTKNSKEDILSQTTLHERKIIGHQEGENRFYTRIWTIKEALSKVLKTGIMTPFNIYEINDIIYSKNYTVSRFSNFSQYQAISFQYEKNIISFILPTDIKILNYDEISFLRT